jgi:hypothetical protein
MGLLPGDLGALRPRLALGRVPMLRPASQRKTACCAMRTDLLLTEAATGKRIGTALLGGSGAEKNGGAAEDC